MKKKCILDESQAGSLTCGESESLEGFHGVVRIEIWSQCAAKGKHCASYNRPEHERSSSPEEDEWHSGNTANSTT